MSALSVLLFSVVTRLLEPSVVVELGKMLLVSGGGAAGLWSLIKGAHDRGKYKAEISRIMADREEAFARVNKTLAEATENHFRLQTAALERMNAETLKYQTEAAKNLAEAQRQNQIAMQAQKHFEECEKKLEELEETSVRQRQRLMDAELRIEGLTAILAKKPTAKEAKA